MLTPQDIAEKRFVKTMISGYDMLSVDEFLEAVSTDYNTLYKENAILKGKLKVLVEKVEEYRSTEDAMRMALLTAQRMGEEITAEAAKTKEEILNNANQEVNAKFAELSKKIAQEEVRLAAASKETAKFIEVSQAIMRKHSEFLKKLEAANQTVKPSRSTSKAAVAVPEPAPPEPVAAAPEPVTPSMPTPAPKKQQTAAPAPKQEAVPKVQPVKAAPEMKDDDFELDNIAEQIGNAVEMITDSIDSDDDVKTVLPKKQEEEIPASLFEEKSDTIEIPLSEEASPRPKFDFDDLKFGANFDNDD